MGYMAERVVVVGSSIAGMLSARVLSDYFSEVLIVDKDHLEAQYDDRRMVPQSRHVHIVLKAGELGLNRLLPGFTGDMLGAGSVPIEMTNDVVSCSAEGVAPRWESGVTLLSQSRALLECEIRKKVLGYRPNIRLLEKTSVSGINYEPSSGKIRGLGLKLADGTSENIDTDLVIDAAGRGALGTRWLKGLSLTQPTTDEMKVSVGYGSCIARLRDASLRDWNGVACGGPVPAHARAGMLMPIEGGLHICSVTSRFDDYPPSDLPGFTAFLQRMPNPFFYEALKDAEIISPIYKIQYESSKFRHYERLNDLPKGFMPIGDAFCSVNPCYGQGMTSSVLQVEVLAQALSEFRQGNNPVEQLPGLFLPRAAKVAKRVWHFAALNDFRYSDVQTKNVTSDIEAVQYHQMVEMLSVSDEDIRRRALNVAHLIDDYSVLTVPEVARKVESLALV